MADETTEAGTARALERARSDARRLGLDDDQISAVRDAAPAELEAQTLHYVVRILAEADRVDRLIAGELRVESFDDLDQPTMTEVSSDG